MDQKIIQDQKKENFCWGCGKDNEHGLQIKSYLSGDELVCTWQPKEYHMAAPGILNGGIIASIIDCHSVWAAIVAAYQTEGREINTEPLIWYVAGSLQITYLKPTPMKCPVILRARVKEIKERKTTVNCSLFANGDECARGEVVAIRVPAAWVKQTNDN